MGKTNIPSTSNITIFDLTEHRASTNNPLDQFLGWFEERSGEHQMELAEFMGHFCYPALYSRLRSTFEKVFAFKEYLKKNKRDLTRSVRILKFVDEVVEFVLEINQAAENMHYNREELLDELPDIVSLQSLITRLPERNQKWTYTYLQWQRFKTQFSFFRGEDISLFVGLRGR